MIGSQDKILLNWSASKFSTATMLCFNIDTHSQSMVDTIEHSVLNVQFKLCIRFRFLLTIEHSVLDVHFKLCIRFRFLLWPFTIRSMHSCNGEQPVLVAC